MFGCIVTECVKENATLTPLFLFRYTCTTKILNESEMSVISHLSILLRLNLFHISTHDSVCVSHTSGEQSTITLLWDLLSDGIPLRWPIYYKRWQGVLDYRVVQCPTCFVWDLFYGVVSPLSDQTLDKIACNFYN